VGHSLSRLAFALHNDFLDLRVVRADEHLRAIEATTAKDLHRLHQEAGMEDWLGQILERKNTTSRFVFISLNILKFI
jgi:hypothetical protein